MDYNGFVDKISKNLFNIDSKSSSCVDFLSSCYKTLSLDSKNTIDFLPSGLDSEQIWQIVNIQNNHNNEILESTSTLLQNSKHQSLYKITTKVSSDKESSEDEEPSDVDDLDDEADDEDVESKPSNKSVPKKQKGKASEVDDDFFKLSEMEAFLDQEENQSNTKDTSGINYFEDIPDEDEDGDELNYNNFYGDQEEAEDNENSEHEETLEEKPLSTFEVREERLKTQMKQFEDDIVAKKSWQLQGETSSKNRPVNSLLEEVLEFDSTSRAPLIITENTSEKLEDIIVNRIKNSLFDDVIRKVINKEKQEYSKQIVLDQEKSKESLSTIYEKQFNNQIDSGSKEANPTHKELSSLMYSLFTKLDSLSNYHVTPQRLQEEARIITNTLSLEVEEVAPVSVSDRNTLAPEEVKVRKQNVLGNSEKTKSAKKKHRKLKAIKYKSKTLDKKATNAKVSKTESNAALKTSTAFFSELQSNTVNLKNKKPMPQTKSSKKMKL